MRSCDDTLFTMGQGAVYRLVFMSVIALFNVVSAEIKIRCCDGDTTVVEGRSQYFNCNGSSVPTSTYHWTLVTESGSTVPLATCYGPNNCSLTSVAETTFPGLRADQSSNTYTKLQVDSIPQEFSGRLTCSQTFDNNTAQSASCAVRVVRIQASDSCDTQEDRSGRCYCENSPVSPSTVTWSLTTDAGLTLYLATCDNVSSCSSPQHENITVTRSNSYFSTVSFTSIQRDKSGQLACSFTYQGVTETDSRQLNIYHPPTIDNCSVGTVPHNWSLLLSCDVSHMFSSRGEYQFRISEMFQLIKGQVTREAGGYVFAGLKSFGDALTAYVDSNNSREYYTGRLVHSWPLSPVPGRYTSFIVYVYPVQFLWTSQKMYSAVTVGPPATPHHNCSDVSCARDTDLSPCVCSTSHLGTPAGRLLWLLGETVLATGDYGVNHLELPHNAVSTTKGWVMVTCQVDWVTPLTVSVVVEAQCTSETNTDNGQATPTTTDQPSTAMWSVSPTRASLTTTDQHNPAMRIDVGAGTVMAVVIVVVVVVVMVIMYGRGRLSACRCHRRAARSSDPVYENTAMETDKHHM